MVTFALTLLNLLLPAALTQQGLWPVLSATFVLEELLTKSTARLPPRWDGPTVRMTCPPSAAMACPRVARLWISVVSVMDRVLFLGNVTAPEMSLMGAGCVAAQASWMLVASAMVLVLPQARVIAQEIPWMHVRCVEEMVLAAPAVMACPTAALYPTCAASALSREYVCMYVYLCLYVCMLAIHRYVVFK